MTSDITSPFTPGRPVSIDFFVGRHNEIETLRAKCRASTSGRIEPVFLTGERGIGKSSLAAFVRSLVTQQDDMLSVHVFLGGVQTIDELVRNVFDQIAKESTRETWWHRISGLFGDHVKKVGLFGIDIAFEPPADQLHQLSRNFGDALRAVYENIEQEKRGLLLVLDDINGLASQLEFANWLKSFIDDASTNNRKLPLTLLMVGLEERRQSLINLNPSIARSFDLVNIDAWSQDEVQDFIAEALRRVGITIEEDALQTIAKFSGGLPVLAHEIGDAAFNLDQDKIIDHRDALLAVFSAAEIVGRKHLQPQVFEAIRSQRYRSILRKVVGPSYGTIFRRSDVIEELTASEKTVFDNFIRRMKDLGVLRTDTESGRGAYAFCNMLHAFYFWMEAQRAQATE